MLPRDSSAERADSVFNYDRVRLQIKKDYQDEIHVNRKMNLPKTTSNATPINLLSPKKIATGSVEKMQDYAGSPYTFNTTYKDLGVSAKVYKEDG